MMIELLESRRLLSATLYAHSNQSISGGTYTSIVLNNVHDVTVQNLTVKGSKTYGIQVSGTCKNIRIVNLDVSACGIAGLGTWGNVSNLYVGSSYFHNNPGVAGQSVSGSGMEMGGLHGAVIELTRCAYNGGSNAKAGGGPVGMWCYASDHVVFRNDESDHNRSIGGDGGGFDFDGGVTDSQMVGCKSHDNHGPGVLICTYANAPTSRNTISNFSSKYDGVGIEVWANGAPITSTTFSNVTIVAPTSHIAIVFNQSATYIGIVADQKLMVWSPSVYEALGQFLKVAA